MFRTMKFAAPVVALVCMLSFGSSARAQEEKADGIGTVTGTVVDSEGKAASGVTVRLVKPLERGRRGENAEQKQATRGERRARQLADAKPEKPQKPGRPGRGDRPKPVASATTDADGKFTMNDLPAGAYVVMANLRGQGMARQPVTVAAGETASVELKLKQGSGNGPGRERGEKPARKPKKDATAE